MACDLSPTAEELADYVVPTASEPFDITLLQVSLAGYYYQAIDYGAHSAGDEAGVEVTTLAAEGYASPDLQLSQIEDARRSRDRRDRHRPLGHPGIYSRGSSWQSTPACRW